MSPTPNFTDNKAAAVKPDIYTIINVDTAKVIKSWQLSIYSFEWLTPDGTIKASEALNDAEKEKRQAVEDALKNNQALERPVLGIGIQDNIEIGSGRAVLMTLAAHGAKNIPVHILKSNESDFKDFLAEVS